MGFLYDAVVSKHNNCSSIIDSTPYVSYDPNSQTLCDGTGTNAFAGNGNFKITVLSHTTNNAVNCVGNVDAVSHEGNSTQYLQ